MDSEVSSKMIGLYNEKKSTVYFVQDSKIPSFQLKQQQQHIDLLQQSGFVLNKSPARYRMNFGEMKDFKIHATIDTFLLTDIG